jgi:serine phosphatase RsbU (regulator of sigma subunit)
VAVFRPAKGKKVIAGAGEASLAAAGLEARRELPPLRHSRPATYFKVPIALKFAAFITVLVVGAVTLQTATAIREAGAGIEREVNKSGVALVTALAAIIDPRSAEERSRQELLVEGLRRVRSMKGTDQVLNIVVYDAASTAVADARGESRFTVTTGRAVDDPRAASSGVEIREFDYDGVPVRSFARSLAPPPAGPAGAAGKIEVYLSAASIAESRREVADAMTKVSVTASLAAAVGAFLLARFLTRPIRALGRDMKKVGHGDLEHQSEVRSSDEVGDLARAFNTMTSSLHAAQEAKIAQRALEHDLSVATDIQTRLLPSTVPEIEGLDISACYVSAKEVGGDYYDFLSIDPEHLGVAVADVSGKGIPGSLVMTMTRSLLRMAATGETSPARTMELVNRFLTPDMNQGMFVTLLYFVIGIPAREVRLVRCGHNAPLLYNSRVEKLINLQPRGIAVGLDREGSIFRAELQVQRFTLQPGDVLLAYTDGVVEAKNADGADYSDGRLKEVFAAHASGSAAQIIEAIVKDVARHRHGAEQSDDMTLVVIKSLFQ